MRDRLLEWFSQSRRDRRIFFEVQLNHPEKRQNRFVAFGSDPSVWSFALLGNLVWAMAHRFASALNDQFTIVVRRTRISQT